MTAAARARLVVRSASGDRLDCSAVDERTARSAAELALSAAAEPRAVSRAVQLDGMDAWLKASPLRGSASLRYSLRRMLLRLDAPREREYANLEWLRREGFQAPQPLAAGTLARGGRIVWQFLLLERLENARPLVDCLPGAAPAERAELLAELAREVARLHALRFIHHDLHLRNVLVGAAPVASDARRLWFVDAWRGGPGHGLRGPAYDLACLMLHGEGLLSPLERERWIERYLEQRRAHGRPAARARL
ncbi:MAG TPA: lipopolysaccharide kinase InaA family protein, partial [Planctomycetota bacterium]|nr:lipopolysaccharide kinase InaA family protein [Planctomycetota bacterium]